MFSISHLALTDNAAFISVINSLPITGTGGNMTQTTTVHLLVGGTERGFIYRDSSCQDRTADKRGGPVCAIPTLHAVRSESGSGYGEGKVGGFFISGPIAGGHTA